MSNNTGLKLLQGRIFNLYQFRDLLVQLVQRDIKLKYRRSVLGYVWSVLNPLLVMAVQAVVFQYMFKRSIENYAAFLISGNILFNFMRESTTHSLTSISGNASLLKKTYVPKYIFSLSKVTSDFVSMLFSFGALIVVLLVYQIPITWHWLLFFIPVIELYVFCLGLSFFLAPAAVFFKDLQYIWTVVTTAWMYLTPLFYEVDFLPDRLRWMVERFNPLYYYVTSFRDLILYNRMPWPPLVVRGGVIAILALLIGIFMFLKSKNKLILYI